MTKYEMRPSVPEDIGELAPRMKKADVDEIWAFSRMRPQQALEISMKYSLESMTCVVDGQVEAMYGIGQPSLLSPFGTPWMLTSDEIFKKRHWRYFMAESRRWVETMKFMYPKLLNYVDARNRKTVRWLKWLGFTVYPAEPMGRDELPFHKFGHGLEN